MLFSLPLSIFPIVWKELAVLTASTETREYKELYLNSKKPDSPIKKWSKDLSRRVSKVDTKGLQGHEKVNITIMKEMQIKTQKTMGQHLTPLRVALVIRNNTTTSAGEDVDKLEPLYAGGRNVKRLLWKTGWRFIAN